MNIQQIIYAVQVYEFKSFTDAAKSLYISQPRLSQAIKELEEELGFEIFKRNRKGISGATVKGYEFIEQSRILLRQFSTLENLRAKSASSFKLACTLITQPQDAFIKLCKDTLPDPNMDLDLWFCDASEAVERVRTMASDIGVVALIDDQLPDWMNLFENSGIEYTEIYSSNVHATISRSNPLASQEVICVDDLKDHTCVAENCTRMNELSLKVHSIIHSISPDSKITVSNTDMMYRIVGRSAKSRAFVLEPMRPAEATLRKYGLASVRISDAFTSHVGYIMLKDQKQSELMARYIELLRQELEQ